MQAAYKGILKNVIFLLEKGADPTLRDVKKRSAIDWIDESGAASTEEDKKKIRDVISDAIKSPSLSKLTEVQQKSHESIGKEQKTEAAIDAKSSTDRVKEADDNHKKNKSGIDEHTTDKQNQNSNNENPKAVKTQAQNKDNKVLKFEQQPSLETKQKSHESIGKEQEDKAGIGAESSTDRVKEAEDDHQKNQVLKFEQQPSLETKQKSHESIGKEQEDKAGIDAESGTDGVKEAEDDHQKNKSGIDKKTIDEKNQNFNNENPNAVETQAQNEDEQISSFSENFNNKFVVVGVALVVVGLFPWALKKIFTNPNL